VQYGTASWYGEPFHGRRTANGEIYDMYEITAAHLVAPLGIYVLVTNLDNGRSARVRINDRGPYVGERILDLSYGAARKLGMIQAGLARVRIEFFPETVPSPTFIVQAGAYLDQDRALRLQKILSARHPQVWVVEAREGSTTFYRVRLGTFSSRSDAEQTARQIAALGYVTSIMPLPSSAHALRPNENRF
jgi:rare lipoprotein A